jgi:hypothetical protein
LIFGLVKGVEISRNCAAIRADGKACTAKALENRRYCVAHSKAHKEEEEDGRLVGSDVR